MARFDKCRGIVAKRGYKIPKDEMEEIEGVYYRKFYKKVNIEAFEDCALGMQIFDCSINCGISRAVKMIQSILHITVDGVCGKQTVTTANIRNSKKWREAYRNASIAYYQSISKKGNNKKYLKGWVNRANECDKDFL